MQYGIVKWFNEGQGRGVIISDSGAAELAVGGSDILGEGFKVLEEGQRVSFDVVKTSRGLSATRVSTLDGKARRALDQAPLNNA